MIGAKHAFTNPAADKLNLPGTGYDAEAERRSGKAMKTFLADVLR